MMVHCRCIYASLGLNELRGGGTHLNLKGALTSFCRGGALISSVFIIWCHMYSSRHLRVFQHLMLLLLYLPAMLIRDLTNFKTIENIKQYFFLPTTLCQFLQYDILHVFGLNIKTVNNKLDSQKAVISAVFLSLILVYHYHWYHPSLTQITVEHGNPVGQFFFNP